MDKTALLETIENLKKKASTHFSKLDYITRSRLSTLPQNELFGKEKEFYHIREEFNQCIFELNIIAIKSQILSECVERKINRYTHEAIKNLEKLISLINEISKEKYNETINM